MLRLYITQSKSLGKVFHGPGDESELRIALRPIRWVRTRAEVEVSITEAAVVGWLLLGIIK